MFTKHFHWCSPESCICSQPMIAIDKHVVLTWMLVDILMKKWKWNNKGMSQSHLLNDLRGFIVELENNFQILRVYVCVCVCVCDSQGNNYTHS